MNLKVTALCTVLLANLLTFSVWAAQKQFIIDDTTGHNTVKFKSDAPLEIISGQTDKVTGHITYDDAFKFDAKHPFAITFYVDLNGFDTGIPLKNKHMQERFLETKLYPTAVFNVKQIQTTAKPPFKVGQVVTLIASGDFTLHGKALSKTIPLNVTYLGHGNQKSSKDAKDKIYIQGSFPLKLADYGIQRPEMVFQKLADTVNVSINTYGLQK